MTEETVLKARATRLQNAYDRVSQHIGEKYNHLTVLRINKEVTEQKLAEKYKTNKQVHNFYIYVDCLCDCGNETTVIFRNLTNNNTTSCGCAKIQKLHDKAVDLTGQKFGRYTVLRLDEEKTKQTNDNKRYWICQCECGNVKTVEQYELTSGAVLSCGCYGKETRALLAHEKIQPNDIKETEYGVVMYDLHGNTCVIDKEDYPIISQYRWYKHSPDGRWCTGTIGNENPERKTIKLHQMVAKIKYGDYDHKSLVVDHLSRNVDDNRKCNIVLKTQAENSRNRNIAIDNTTGKTGVQYVKNTGQYHAYLNKSGVNYNLGYYDNFNDAVAARVKAEVEFNYTFDDRKIPYDYDTQEET